MRLEYVPENWTYSEYSEDGMRIRIPGSCNGRTGTFIVFPSSDEHIAAPFCSMLREAMDKCGLQIIETNKDIMLLSDVHTTYSSAETRLERYIEVWNLIMELEDVRNTLAIPVKKTMSSSSEGSASDAGYTECGSGTSETQCRLEEMQYMNALGWPEST